MFAPPSPETLCCEAPQLTPELLVVPPSPSGNAQPRAMRAVVRPRGHHQRAEARRAPRRSRLAQFLVENWAFGIMTAVMVQAAAYLSVKDQEDSASLYPCPTCVT